MAMSSCAIQATTSLLNGFVDTANPTALPASLGLSTRALTKSMGRNSTQGIRVGNTTPWRTGVSPRNPKAITCAQESSGTPSGIRNSRAAPVSAHWPVKVGAAIMAPPVEVSSTEADAFWKRSRTSDRLVPPSPDFEEETSDEVNRSSFRWDQQWYAVAVLEDLDAAVPHPITLLGRPMVLWRDSSGEWRCFADECPHRRAPLSEGRINEQGDLSCSYHGWAFSGSGSCSCLPQALPGTQDKIARANVRSRCTAFPTQVSQIFVHVWPDENSAELAASTPPPIVPEIDEPGWWPMATARDLPYGYEFLAENFADPVHVHVAHHKCWNFNRNMVRPVNLQVTGCTENGFTGYNDEDMVDLRRTLFPQAQKIVMTNTWSPNLSIYRQYMIGKDDPDGPMEKIFATSTFMIPVSPGKCRVISCTLYPTTLPMYTLLSFLNNHSRWWMHSEKLRIFDGDNVLLHLQELRMKKKVAMGRKWNQDYFLPTDSDNFILAFRQWLGDHGHGGVNYHDGLERLPVPFDSPPKEELLSRYNQHTKQCKTCTKALANFGRASAILSVIAAASLLFAGGCVGVISVCASMEMIDIAESVAAVWISASLAVAALSGAGIMACKHGTTLLTYTGWDHARMEP